MKKKKSLNLSFESSHLVLYGVFVWIKGDTL